MPSLNRHITLLFGFSGHFLDVEGNGKEGKVHGDLVLTEVAEAFVVHVVLHLSEDRLRLYGTLGAVLKSFFRGQPLARLALVFHEAVVDLNLPVTVPLLVASPSQGASLFISVGMLIDPSSLSEYWLSIVYVSLVIIFGMILFGTLGCWWGGQTMRDSMLISFSFVQIGEFSFIIASLGTSLGVLNPIIYPIIVASSVVTTFLTPYIMKAVAPCYTFLYNHASESLRAKIDRREQEVAEKEAEAAKTSDDENSLASKVRHAVRKTYITKHLVDLFIRNMSAHDENHSS